MDDAPRRRALRSDAAANREALLATAARIVRERGPAVPLSEVAAEAGVGIGTLYRHFPDRDALLAALGARTHDVLLAAARDAAARAGLPPRDALAAFLDAVIARREELVLPSLAGPAARASASARGAILDALDPVVRRGVAEGDLRADATAADVVLAAALVVAPFTPTTTGAADARRHAAIHLDGLTVDRGGGG